MFSGSGVIYQLRIRLHRRWKASLTLDESKRSGYVWADFYRDECDLERRYYDDEGGWVAVYIRDVRGERPFSILHHFSAAHAGLQAVDYCTWAVHRKLRGDGRSYERIRCWIRSEWKAFG